MAHATQKDTRTAMKESVEQVWLAGLGALALTEEEGEKFFRSLVKKGEVVERRSRARLDEALTAARKVPSKAVETIGQRTDDVVAGVMHRLGVPTRREIAGLTRRIEGLTATIEKKPRPRRASTTRSRTESQSAHVS